MTFPDNVDIRVSITAARRKGVYANNVVIRRGRSVRNAGQAPREASSHTLCVLALITGLRTIGRKQAAQIAEANCIRKPRVLVTVGDASFADAIAALLSGTTHPTLRAGKNFMRELERQLNRFDITFETAAADNPVMHALRTWAVQFVHDPREVAKIPAILVPAAISLVR